MRGRFWRCCRVPRKASVPAKPPRRRRDAEAARAAILDAAERQLVLAGPSGLRLQDVAKDAGVSHPTVLHHFGSRDALMKEVITRSLETIHTRLVAAIESSTGDEQQLASMLEGVFDALATGGHGRVMMWLALGGEDVDVPGTRLVDVVDATHALRRVKLRERGSKSPLPKREDTAHVVVLAALALLGSSVMGAKLLKNAGLPHDEAGGARFRGWLARVLKRHLDG